MVFSFKTAIKNILTKFPNLNKDMHNLIVHYFHPPLFLAIVFVLDENTGVKIVVDINVPNKKN